MAFSIWLQLAISAWPQMAILARRQHQTGPKACGRTKVIRYDGTVIASLLCEEDILIADLDLDAQADFRRTFPIPQL